MHVTPTGAAAAAAPGIALDGLDHVAINVKDVKRSVAWYQKVFGFRVLHTWPSGTTMVGRDNIKIGLYVRPKASPLPLVGKPPRPDIDSQLIIQHFAFLVDGDKFGAALAALQRTGIPYDGPDDTGIACSIFVYDPDGHKVELTWYHPKDYTCPARTSAATSLRDT